ncbi:MAG: divalent-cation tolerance protein CutA [Blastocatellia bacterium]
MNSAPTEFVIVITTVENQRDGDVLSHLLVTRELAACVQTLPAIASVYRWQGKVERATEHLLLIKTTRALYPELEQVIREHHPYQTPEILALPVLAGSPDYLAWLASMVKAPDLAS